MKFLLFSISLFFTICTSQAQNIEGTYVNEWVAETGEGIKYSLSLHEDGRFTFEHTRLFMNADDGTTIQVNGNWQLTNNLLILDTENSNEPENRIASGLNLNKARFISISPRNPNFNLVQPSLKFFESEVFYAKDMELVKTATTVSISK